MPSYNRQQKSAMGELFNKACDLAEELEKFNKSGDPPIKWVVKKNFKGQTTFEPKESAPVGVSKALLKFRIREVEYAYGDAQSLGVGEVDLINILHKKGIYLIGMRQHKGDNPEEDASKGSESK